MLIAATLRGVEEPVNGPRPQAILLTFLGGYLLGRGEHVAMSSLIAVLAGAGVSEHATRSTVSRMARRGQLRRVRRGRQVYVGLTPTSRAILRDGDRRVWRTDVVNPRWDGTWTLLSFSLPESWQRQRNALRSRLLWAGFGPLQGGLWVTPAPVDVQEVCAGLEAAVHVRAFTARALEPTDVAEMVRDAWDLPALADRYRAFRARWTGERPVLPDPLAAQIVLQADWLDVIRRDPRLPAQHLPPDWPAVPAQRLFRELYAELDQGARRVARDVLDVIPDEEAAGGEVVRG
ncbi:PaaX family transcriptional regulator [Pseudonocardia sp. CA-107938]|uniref:PaaX family transcriptional regulator n=1 Tax=Pseudonocardia sp. CA-107938 TaxID=3240021 RepID=UPI003D8FF787